MANTTKTGTNLERSWFFVLICQIVGPESIFVKAGLGQFEFIEFCLDLVTWKLTKRVPFPYPIYFVDGNCDFASAIITSSSSELLILSCPLEAGLPYIEIFC